MSININLRNRFTGRINPSVVELEEDQAVFGVSISDVPDIKACVDWFVSMVNGEYDLYGMCGNFVKLNDMIFEFLEDPDDGYRSHLGAVRIAADDHGLIFFNKPLAKVKLVNVYAPEQDCVLDLMHPHESFQGYHLVDIKDGHLWAMMGTSNTNDYYPFFITSWFPKRPKT